MGSSMKRLVVINFFPAFAPPSSGGEQRYFHLYECLSREFDVTLLSATYADAQEECVTHSTSFREYRIPKPSDADVIQWHLRQNGIGNECSGYALAVAASDDSHFKTRVGEFVSGADIVIHECPFTVPYDEGIGQDGVPRVYNSYNVESDLARQMFSGWLGEQAADFIGDLEHFLIRQANLVCATSEEDARKMAALYGIHREAICLVPNGFVAPGNDVVHGNERRDAKTCLFMGSAHPPNIEAVGFICDVLAKQLPEAQFNIIGSVCKAYEGMIPANVRMLGLVDEAEKHEQLNRCTVAINPLASGSGTNLKMLDYMAHGAPIVTTTVGARGLSLIPGVSAQIAALEDFSKIVAALIGDRSLGDRLGIAARQHVGQYAWCKIAGSYGRDLHRLLESRDKANVRPRILILGDYRVDSPRGGGEVRVNRLLRELGRQHEVEFVCLSDDGAETCTQLAPHVLQYAIPKTSSHRDLDKTTMEGEWVSIADVLAARMCTRNERLVALVKEKVKLADIVVFEQCFLEPLLQFIPEGMPVVYSSQNHEHSLKSELLRSRRDYTDIIAEVAGLEARMCKRANSVICVSEDDAKAFVREFGSNCHIVGNGVDLGGRSSAKRSVPQDALALFVGSGHPPNVDAVRFIVEKIAPATPGVTYCVVGSVCNGFQQATLPANVILLGFLENEEKDALMHVAQIAVNPLFAGGGSSLKVPDYFAAGLAMVSSVIGVRGFPVRDGIDCVIATEDAFAGKIMELASDPARCVVMGRQGRRLVEREYDWRLLGGKYSKVLNSLIGAKQGRPKLLIATYRAGVPSRGGAEIYLEELTKHLRKDMHVTLAAPRVGAIHNHLHFSAMYEDASDAESIPGWVDEFIGFELDAPPQDVPEASKMLHKLWARESIDIGRRLIDSIPDGLLGGWNFPEKQQGGVVRWTTACAEIKLPPWAKQIDIELFSPSQVHLRVMHDDIQLAYKRVEGHVHLSMPLSCAEQVSILTIACPDAGSAVEDVRELGVQVSAITVEGSSGKSTINLAEGHESWHNHVESRRWVETLMSVAEARDPAQDELFTHVRGPWSAAMERWLTDHLSDYDAVLVQGVPFSTSSRVIKEARMAGVPTVLLPHAHIEDRYYHWQSFYDAYRSADRVLAAPDASIPLFFARIGATAIRVPGGGAHISEFSEEALAKARHAFRAVHQADDPFVLILGRKADGKNYQAVIRATETTGLPVVMIGPDEDGHKISAHGVTYLGRQSREVLVGALAEAACLATMSESESFGIVLIEAWLAGTPVVANRNCQAFAELVEDGTNGVLVGTQDELRVALAEYCRNPTIAGQHALAGRRKALTYDWTAIAEEISKVITEAIATK